MIMTNAARKIADMTEDEFRALMLEVLGARGAKVDATNDVTEPVRPQPTLEDFQALRARRRRRGR